MSHTPRSEPHAPLMHSRNLSTISGTTLHTNTTSHSQPLEPLLQTNDPGAQEVYDPVYRQSRHSEGIVLHDRWSQSNVTQLPSTLSSEKEGYPKRRSFGRLAPTRKVKLLRWVKRGLHTAILIWAAYSTARYLRAFTLYESTMGQIVSIVLGISAGLSFAFSSCFYVLSIFQTSLLLNGLPAGVLLSVRSSLQVLSYICFFGPSVANLALTIAWKDTIDNELQLRNRCQLDVDIVWSTTQVLCQEQSSPLYAWISLAAVRMFLTLSIIIAFHLVISSSQFMPPVKFIKTCDLKEKKSHQRLASEQPTVGLTNSIDSAGLQYLNRNDPITNNQASQSSLSSKASPRNRLHPSRSCSSSASGHAPSYENQNFLPMGDTTSPNFVDRFRALIYQITRETEEGLALAQSDATSSYRSRGDDLESPEPQNMPYADIQKDTNQSQDLGYDPFPDYDEDEDEFYSGPGRAPDRGSMHRDPYPDERIQMMNGFIQRMPTIESMGSRERGSFGASSHGTNYGERPGSASGTRPPTRATHLSWASTEISDPSQSRSNSLTAQAEILAGMFSKNQTSEVGELLRRGDTVRMTSTGSNRRSGASELDDSAVQEESSESYDTSTGGSKETMASFHTASTGSGITGSTSSSLKRARVISTEVRLVTAIPE